MPNQIKPNRTEQLQKRINQLHEANSNLTDKAIISSYLAFGLGVLALFGGIIMIEKINQIENLNQQNEYLKLFKDQIDQKNNGRYNEQEFITRRKMV